MNNRMRVPQGGASFRRLSIPVVVAIVIALYYAVVAVQCDPASDSASALHLASLEAQVAALGRLLAPLDAALPAATQRVAGGSELLAWDEGMARIIRLRSAKSRLRKLSEALAAINAALRASSGGGDGLPAADEAGSPLLLSLLERAQASPSALAAPSSGTAAPSLCRCAACHIDTASPAAAAAQVAAPLPGGGMSDYDRFPQRAGAATFVTYGDDSFTRSRTRLAREAASYPGVFAHVLPLNRSSIDPAWAAANAALLAARRGGGFWVWKPHLLLRVLEEHMQYGDVLLYVDAGCTLVADPSPYLALAATHGLVLFRNVFPMWSWTKGFTFKAAGVDMADYGDIGQVAAGIIALQKRPWVLALLREWEQLMTKDPRVVNDDNTSALVANHPSFNEHRHDQSVLSLLAVKYGIFCAPYRSWPREKALIVAATRIHG